MFEPPHAFLPPSNSAALLRGRGPAVAVALAVAVARTASPRRCSTSTITTIPSASQANIHPRRGLESTEADAISHRKSFYQPPTVHWRRRWPRPSTWLMPAAAAAVARPQRPLAWL
ncbi:hypothetical protein DCS_07390 [Drechmeria coniospora]|uniref:Uncharacterized protein n=1 Tax=Drechmeria coniospora TaxID=98403 RepID=A0A151GEA4_DRECN|nr:hypothetical protein DCS_07390 [Drechmeria coniospora]KYK55427.1 hypothetical protein DCS_07390 [Drechmeria coniospora]